MLDPQAICLEINLILLLRSVSLMKVVCLDQAMLTPKCAQPLAFVGMEYFASGAVCSQMKGEGGDVEYH